MELVLLNELIDLRWPSMAQAPMDIGVVCLLTLQSLFVSDVGIHIHRCADDVVGNLVKGISRRERGGIVYAYIVT